MRNWPFSLEEKKKEKKTHTPLVGPSHGEFARMPDFAYSVSKLRALLFTANAIYFFKPSEMLDLSYRLDERYLRLIIGSGSCFSFPYILDVKILRGEGMLDVSCSRGGWLYLGIMILIRYSFLLFLTLPRRFFFFWFFVFFLFFTKRGCHLVFVVAAFRLARRQAGGGMSFTAFVVAVASMMTEMLLL